MSLYEGLTQQWQSLTLLGTWSNYSSAYNPAGYFKDAHSVVHLRGLITATMSTSTIATLPTSYRPQYREVFIVLASGLAGRVDVDNLGNIILITGGATYLSLDGLSFRAYQ